MTQPLTSVFTQSFAELLKQLKISLVVSTYQAGKVILVRYDPDTGTVNTHFRNFDKPMGIVVRDNRLSIGGARTVWELRNMPALAPKLEPQGRHDACYLPRRIHITGDIDIHEMAWGKDGSLKDDQLWLINTRFCCLCTLDVDHSFNPRWRPPFVSALAPEDRCHLNGLSMVNDRPKYVTALGQTDTPGGWRANKANGGLLMDIDTNEILLEGLSMPHSPRWYREQLWLLESGEGSLARVDLESGRWQTIAEVPGFSRGIDFLGPLAFIGLSQVRESAVFSGIPLVKRLKERNCGVWVVHIETGKVVGFLRFDSGVEEIFAVQILEHSRYPEMLDFDDPHLAQAYVLPDAALAEVKLPSEAELAQSPNGLFQQGLLHYQKHKLDESIAAFQQCLQAQTSFPNARYNLGVALGDAGQFTAAIEQLQQVINDEPDRAEVYNSLGYVYSRQGQHSAAIEAYQQAIEQQPDDAQAHFNLGMTLLKIGDYLRGWEEYDWRWRTGQFTPFQCPHPLWDGEPIPEQTLLLYTEQGAGDAVQFARYIRLAAERCKRLMLVCTVELMPLFASLPEIHQLREAGQINVSEFDTYLPLMSLPRVFKTTLDSIPVQIPYFDPAAIRRRKTTKALTLPTASGTQIGIVWAGNPGHANDRHRSCPLSAFEPLLDNPELHFYSLQKGERSEDLATLPASLTVHNMAPQLNDYGDLALLLEPLELIISVDTSVAHVAAALGKPVWLLLSQDNDWRWGVSEETTPWYPGMRLFRQTRLDDWEEMMVRVLQALL